MRIRVVSVIVGALIIGGGVYAILQSNRAASSVPDDFTTARMQGALISQNIVDLSNTLDANLGKINQLDKEKNYTQALALTQQLLQQSRDIRAQAVGLSKELEVMAQNLDSIHSSDARQAALEAISDRLALISRLINYSGYLEDLLNALGNRFAGSAPGNAQVSAIVNEINSEVTAINNFNNNAGAAMEKFDKVVNGK